MLNIQTHVFVKGAFNFKWTIMELFIFHVDVLVRIFLIFENIRFRVLRFRPVWKTNIFK